MDRRSFAVSVGFALAGVPLVAVSQQPKNKVPRLGFLRADPPPPGYTDAFEQGLRDHGYIVGKSILIDYRFGDGSTEEVSRLAQELVKSRIDVIVAGGGQATRAAKSATSTIPIVMTFSTDPGAPGTVSSLAHPGGNVTGSITLSWDLFGKRLELLKELLPTVSRVAVLHNSRNPAPKGAWQQSLVAAAALGVKLQRVEVQSSSQLQQAFATMIAEGAEALVVVQSTMFNTPPYPVARLAASYRIPAIYGSRVTSADAGLISYGPNNRSAYRHAATFVDKILKGARPGDLPVERPTRFDLVINVRTAKDLGLPIPQVLLLRADELIE